MLLHVGGQLQRKQPAIPCSSSFPSTADRPCIINNKKSSAMSQRYMSVRLLPTRGSNVELATTAGSSAAPALGC
eukprot:6196805-Pleurochrysis_carterae.AAC.1